MNLLTKNSLRILHLEDTDIVAEIVEVLLNLKGFSSPIVRFDCGQALMDYLSKVEPVHAPHVILLDLQMPGMSGIQVLKWIRQEYWDTSVPVCILSSSSHPEDIRQALAAGATKYFLKTSISGGLALYLEKLVEKHNEQDLEIMKKLPGTLSELALLSKFTENMVVLTDTEGLIVWVNESFVKTCGYTLEEALGWKPGSLLQGPKSDPASVRALRHAVRSATPCDCTLVNYRKSKETYPVHISLGPIFDNNGKLDGFLAVERELANTAN